MTSDQPDADQINVPESTVTAEYTVEIPESIRSTREVAPGDRVRWHVTEAGLCVELVRERPGAFDDFEPFDLCETDAPEDHDAVAVDVQERD